MRSINGYGLTNCKASGNVMLQIEICNDLFFHVE